MSTYRRDETLRGTLSDIALQERPPDHLILVDNDPTGAAEAALAEYASSRRSVQYVASPENVGPAGAIEAAMRAILEMATDGDWIVLFDDDDPPRDDSVLRELVAAATEERDRNPAVAAVGLRGAALDRRMGRLIAVNGRGLADADYLHSQWFPLYSVNAIRQVGGFSSDLFFGFEELEFGLRLRRAGYRVLVWDRNGAMPLRSTRPSFRVTDFDWRSYYSLRNLIHILRQNDALRGACTVAVIAVAKPLANLPLRPRNAFKALRSNLRAIADGWRGNLGRPIDPDGSLRRGKTPASTLASPRQAQS
jgi:glycosyltransferase involved in cell wall biosynthesis